MTSDPGVSAAPSARALPEGILGRADLARLLGVAFPTIISWEEAKSLPAPDFVTATGRRLWLASAIQIWLPDSGLHRCPDCGAYSRRPALHQSQRHR